MKELEIDAAQIGKMFVIKVEFDYHCANTKYDNKTGKSMPVPAYWSISASLTDKLNSYENRQTMTLNVEQGIGQKLAEVLIPVVIQDASRKAQQLADDSKAMLEALGDRTLKALTVGN